MAYSQHQSSGVSISVCRYDELSSGDLEDWRKLCSQHTDYDSALLSPEFSQVIASVRDDVRIIIARTDGQLDGVLPVHLRPDGLARPLGAPFSDYSGPILARDTRLSPANMLDGTGVAAFQTAAMPDPWHALTLQDGDDSDNHIIRATNEAGSLLEAQRQKHAKRFKNFRRQQHQIEREAGELRLDWGQPTPELLQPLLRYKQEQYRRSGLVDLTQATESARLLNAVAESEHGFQTSLWIGDRFVSGHFGIRVGASFHPWIAAFDPAFSHYSPGTLLLMRLLDALPEMGISSYDLANGHDHYKKYFANDSRRSAPLSITGRGFGAWRQTANRAMWKGLGAGGEDSLTGRLRRRMDQISVSEFGASARIRGFLYAVAARSVLARKR